MTDPKLTGITTCPNCGEPNDPEFDCELFGCANQECEKIICENCASSGMCETCDGEKNGTVTVRFTTEPTERTKALREARALIQQHAMSTWRGGLTERSDGITGVLVDFDLKFPEALT